MTKRKTTAGKNLADDDIVKTKRVWFYKMPSFIATSVALYSELSLTKAFFSPSDVMVELTWSTATS